MKLNYGFRDSIRLRAGLRWKGEAPTLNELPNLRTAIWYVLAAALAMALGLAVAGSTQAIEDAKQAQAMLLDCLNGRNALYYENESGHGHGRTYLTCRVEEVEV